MLSDELRNKWKEEIEEDWVGDSETLVQLRRYILKEKENAYMAGEIQRLEENLAHYRKLYDEDDCSCLGCMLDDDDDEDEGRGRDGLPRKPKPIPELSEDEKTKLGNMWGEE